jgi:hypothetical protein
MPPYDRDSHPYDNRIAGTATTHPVRLSVTNTIIVTVECGELQVECRGTGEIDARKLADHTKAAETGG